MKPIAFLRNTWKKLDRGSESRNSSPGPSSHSVTDSPASSIRALKIRFGRTVIEDVLGDSQVPIPPPKDDILSPMSSTFPSSTSHRHPHRIASVSSDTVSLADYPTYLQDPFNSTNPSPNPVSSRPSLAPSTSRSFAHASPYVSRSNENDLATCSAPQTRLRKISTSSLRQQYPRLPALDPTSPIDLECRHMKNCSYDDSDCSARCIANATWPTHCHRREHSDRDTDQSNTRTPPKRLARSPTAASIFPIPSSPTKPRGLYQTLAESSPHLPYDPVVSTHTPSEKDAADTFPLSLFPPPPPLIVRKKRPSPLIIRPMDSISTLSSIDSVTVGTPTTTVPRSGPLILPDSPSQSIASSPTLNKKTSFVRSIAISSPPPTSPPNSPLPDPPAPRPYQRSHTLRLTHSSSNLHQSPQPRRRRLTSSEPIHGATPTIQNPAAQQCASQRTGIYVGKINSHGRLPAPAEGHIQWGYAF